MSNEYTDAAEEYIYEEVIEMDMETMKAELRATWQPYGLVTESLDTSTLEQVQNMLVTERLEQSADRYSYRQDD
jgi:hypothetical protein